MADEAFPILAAADLRATQRFYESLGFSPTYRFPPAGEPEFVTLERGTSTVGIAVGSGRDDAFAYWVYVDDVDETVGAMRAAGAPVVAEPVDQPWGERVAQVRDPDGHLVHLGTRTTETPSGVPPA
jgi:lactoylglutathione lyase